MPDEYASGKRRLQQLAQRRMRSPYNLGSGPGTGPTMQISGKGGKSLPVFGGRVGRGGRNTFIAGGRRKSSGGRVRGGVV